MTATDVVYHYGRLYGIGAGFTKPSPYVASTTMTSVASTDKYTVVFKFNVANAAQNLITIQGVSSTQCIEASDVVNQWGDANDWHHAIGTGPFILTDVVSSGSATMVKNPAYWGYDERYPQNKLPYADSLKILVIPDNATALAAVRTGKIDLIDSVTSATALLVQKSNPAILQVPVPANSATTIDPRNDMAPYKDIRVREALQMAIDLPGLAANYYNNLVSPSPSSLTSIYQNGGGFPYSAWPQDLKDTYTYNPTAAKKLLADAGFPSGFKTDIVVDSAADQDLLQAIKSYFLAIGVDMEIRPMDTSSWASFVMTNHKQDALAQRTTGTLGQTQTAVAQLNRFRTGVVYNYIGVSDSPKEIFGKTLSIPDKLIYQYFELVTDVPEHELTSIKSSLVNVQTNPRDIKRQLARTLVRMYHSQASADDAEKEFDKIFIQKSVPDNIEEFTRSGSMSITALLTDAKLVASKSEARRLIDQGGVSIDDERVIDPNVLLPDKDEFILKVGKRRFLKVKR